MWLDLCLYNVGPLGFFFEFGDELLIVRGLLMSQIVDLCAEFD